VKKIFILVLILSVKLYSNDIDEANMFYKNGDYQKALEIYKKYEEETNPYILYNIGNCYYKLNNQPYALAYYIKAFNLNSRVSNIRENMIKVASENGEELFSEDIPKIIYLVYYWLNKDEILSIFELFFIILTILIIYRLQTKKHELDPYIIITITLMAIFGLWYILRKNSLFYKSAVTLNETDLYSGPKETFTQIATIPRSRVVEVLSENDGFIEVGIVKENTKGWVKSESIIKTY
jgi:tetratricopeptide (TPR) repeat protein